MEYSELVPQVSFQKKYVTLCAKTYERFVFSLTTKVAQYIFQSLK